jgi:hypothetical protein
VFSEKERTLRDQVGDQSLQLCLDNLRIAVDGVWSSGAPRIVHDFTDHGLPHYERIAGYAENILKANQQAPLSPVEMFLLLGGINLHDIGMQCDVTTEDGHAIKLIAEEIGAQFNVAFTAQAANQYSFAEQKAIRKNHHYLSAAWIRYAHETGKTALGQGAQQIPYQLIPDLMDICLYHTSKPINECDSELTVDVGRKRMVAALLRFADELDIAANRVSMSQVTEFSINAENSVFWWLHNLTHVAFRPPNIFKITVALRTSEFDEFEPIVRTAYLERFRQKNAQTLTVLHDAGINVYLDASSTSRHKYAYRSIRSGSGVTIEHLHEGGCFRARPQPHSNPVGGASSERIRGSCPAS